MACFTVGYQLNKTKNYVPSWDELKRLDGHRVMNSFWFIDAEATASGLVDHLRAFIDGDDAVCVVPFDRRPSHNKGFVGTNAWLDARF